MSIVPFVGGNWKCNGTSGSVQELVGVLNAGGLEHEVEVVVCPPHIHLESVKGGLRNPKIAVGAQNAIPKGGAFTGEVSVEQLVDMGIQWVILGHSERRHVFGETDEGIAAKVKASLEGGLRVIPCVGETLPEREAGRTLEVVLGQLKCIADQVTDWSRTVIAYEPVWAIGTGKTATPQQAQEVHAAIRKWLRENGPAEAAGCRILYGGSVNEKNAAELYQQPDVNGFLVGGASLKPAFVDICRAASGKK